MTQIANPTPADVDILVVGAGPAGLATAIAAAHHGASVLLVERHAGTSIHPRATGVSTRSMELFRSWGVAEEIRAGAVTALPLMAAGPTLAGPHTVVPFGYPASMRDVLAVSPTVPACCPQDHIEPVLLAHLRGLGAEVRFGTELATLRADEHGVTATFVDRPTGGIDTVRARYVVGADGPRSTVRTALGIPATVLGQIGDYVNIIFRADLDAVLGEPRYVLYAVEDAEAGGVILPAGGGRWMYGKQYHAGESPADFTPQRCVALIRRAAAAPDLAVEVLTVQPFSMVGQLAESYRAGRGFLVGDAAHQMTPVGGVGMNTAMHDGHNLGWKLAWVVRGWADQALLDSYQAERRPVGERNTRNSLRMGGPPEPENALLKDLGVVYRSGAIATDAPVSETEPDPLRSAAPGRRAPHAWVRHEGKRMSTLDLFDGRLTLLVGRRARGWQRAGAAAGAGRPMRTLALGWDVADPKGTVADRYGIGEHGAVLVRPDGYVAWRSAVAVAQPTATLSAVVAGLLGARAKLPVASSA